MFPSCIVFNSLVFAFSQHDATPTVCTFNLNILDTLKGLHKARECKFFDFKNFNIEEYEYFEKVENGDLSWSMDGKFIMFAGPHATREMSPGGYQTLCPENYIPYFKRKNVTLVIRLNKKYYDSKRFTSQGIDHADLYFLDGSNPPPHILRQFIQRCEETRGAVAVHCKAGLGRTGCCIGCYMMKHFRFTAEETIGWLRIVRPGSIIGPQQDWMREMEQQMWREGEMYRARLQSLTPPTLDSEDTTPTASNGGGNTPNAPGGTTGGEPAPTIGTSGRSLSGGARLSMTVRSGSNNQLLAAQAAAMAKEDEGVSQGDQLRARRQMKDSPSPSPGSTIGAFSPPYQASAAGSAMSPLSRSGARSLLNNTSNGAASYSSPNKTTSYSLEAAPSTPTPGSSFYNQAAAPSPVQGAPQSPASPTKRKTTLGSFLGLS
jgi:protein-tyrosine phosphatase